MKKRIKDIVNKLKENEEDWNFYPTTDEIIKALHSEIKKDDTVFSMLDVGAGNGQVFAKLEKIGPETDKLGITKYAIEKSKILIENMDKDIFVIGTNFNEQTLIDKKVDIIFSNPPYSDFVQWAEKIITEANSKDVYLVLPQRWEKSKEIAEAIKLREGKHKVIGSFDFEDAERRARAKVHLIKITLTENGDYKKTEPFDLWFNKTFKFDAEKTEMMDYQRNEEKAKKLNSLVSKENLILTLEYLYKKEMEKIIRNYRLLEKMDRSLFEELKISIEEIKAGLKLRIEGLKNLYWKELFDNLDVITDRLTHKSRKDLLGILMENTTVDFTAGNVYSVIIWVIKNANAYFDDQLLKLYLTLSSRENIRLYKSNHRIIEDGWRYSYDKMSHYSLDYRIVHHSYGAIVSETWRSGSGLDRSAEAIIHDIITIGKNLGFNVIEKKTGFQWVAGEKKNFYYKKNNIPAIFVEIKAFKNGNLHFKFVPDFMKKLNIEAARLNGWIKSPQEAVNEFDITLEEASKMYKGNYFLSTKKIGTLIELKEENKNEKNNHCKV